MDRGLPSLVGETKHIHTFSSSFWLVCNFAYAVSKFDVHILCLLVCLPTTERVGVSRQFGTPVAIHIKATDSSCSSYRSTSNKSSRYSLLFHYPAPQGFHFHFHLFIYHLHLKHCPPINVLLLILPFWRVALFSSPTYQTIDGGLR